MKVLIFMCWGFMLFGLIVVLASGPTGPGDIALGGAIACLAGIFFIFYRSMYRMSRGEHYMIEGKRLALLFVLIGVGILLAFLTVGLD